MGYATNGNISSKSDVGTYTYDPTKLNAVSAVTNPLGGVSLNTQTVDYNSFRKAQTIKEIDVNNPSSTINELDYTYGPDQQRKKGILKDASGSTLSTTWYQNNYEKIVLGSGANTANFTETNYIGGGDGICAMFINDQSGVANGKLYYVFTDYLGSILKLTDENGTTVAEQSFDAWGKPRDPANWANAAGTATLAGLIRGYTGHEHLPQFNLINMNARLYDPINARVVSADNDLEDDENTQNYNRYTYCLNNPLKYTDPTGNDEEDEDDPDLSKSTSVSGGLDIGMYQYLQYVMNLNFDMAKTTMINIGIDNVAGIQLSGPLADPTFNGQVQDNGANDDHS